MSERLSPQREAEIAARVEAATDGPWRQSEDYNDIHSTDGDHLASYWHTADGEFIAHAREDVPALLAEVERLKAVLAAEMSAHRFTLRQRNNRSNRILQLQELAHGAASGDAPAIEALIAAARDTLAASRDDHANCAAEDGAS